MAVDLGDVTLGLTASTRGLEEAIERLRRFGQEVNKFSRMAGEGAAATTAALSRQEQVLSRLMTKLTQQQQLLKGLQPSADVSDQLARITKAYNGLHDALTKGEVETYKLSRAREYANRVVQQSTMLYKDLAAAQRAATSEEERAAIAAQRLGLARQTSLIRASTKVSAASFPAESSISTAAGATLVEANARALTKYETALNSTSATMGTFRTARAQFERDLRSNTEEFKRSEMDAVSWQQQSTRLQKQALREQSEERRLATTIATREAREQANEERLLGTLQRQERARDTALMRQSSKEQSDERRRAANVAKVAATEQANEEKLYADFARQERARDVALQRQQARENAIVAREQRASRVQQVAEQREQLRVQREANSQEAAIVQARTRVATMNAQAVSLRGEEGAARYIQQNATALAAYETQIRTTQRSVGGLALAKANLGGVLNQNKNAFMEAGTLTEKLALRFRELERAAILAYGPLSGVGARLAVLSAMFESTAVGTVLMIAALTGVGVALYMLAAHGIRAQMEWEKFNAQMLVATGSAITVKDRMDSVIEFTDRMGQRIQEVIPAYSKFAASARLAGVALKDQTALFEASIKAATALRLAPEQTGRIFLAFEQMASKGTVMTEELKRQLGDVLPGAMEMGAMAMGMSLGKFMVALRNNEIEFRTFAPKYAKTMEDLFGAAALKGSESTLAKINQLSNAWLLFGKTFDETIRTSAVFKEFLQALTSGLNWLSANLKQTLEVVGAFGGAFAGWFIARAAMALVIPAATGVATAFYGLSNAIIRLAQGMAIADAVATRTIIGAFLKMGVVAVGAIVGFRLVEEALEKVSHSGESNISVVEEQIKQWQKLGSVTKQTAEETQIAMMNQMNALDLQMQNLQASIKAKMMAQIDPSKLGIWDRLKNMLYKSAGRNLPEEELQADKEALQALEEEFARYGKAWEALGGIKKTVPDLTPADDKSVEHFRQKLRKMIEDYKAGQAEMEAISRGAGTTELEGYKAIAEAFKILEDAPKKFNKGEIPRMFREVGIEADDAASALFIFLDSLNAIKRNTRDAEDFFKNIPQHMQAISDKLEEARQEAQTAGDSFEQFSRRLNANGKDIMQFSRMIDAAFKGTPPDIMSEEQVKLAKERLTEVYAHWKQLSFEGWAKNQMDDLVKEFATATEKINEKWRQVVEKINALSISPGIDPVKIGSLLGDALLEWDRALREHNLKTYFSDLTRAVESWRDKTTDAISEMVVHGKFTFRELFDSITMDITKMVTKRLITDPLYKILFGDIGGAKTPNAGGLFGKGLEFLVGGGAKTEADQKAIEAKQEKSVVEAGNIFAEGFFSGLGKIFDSFGTFLKGIFGGLFSGGGGELGPAINALIRGRTGDAAAAAGIGGISAAIDKYSKSGPFNEQPGLLVASGALGVGTEMGAAVGTAGAVGDMYTKGAGYDWEKASSEFFAPIGDFAASLGTELSSGINSMGSIFSSLLTGLEGIFASFLSGFAAEQATSSGADLLALAGIPGMATGGDILAGQAAWVGERGTELFMPKQSGTIIPNNKLSGLGRSITNNVNVHVQGNVTRSTAAQIGAEVARQLTIHNARKN